jgi:hypothetical protein
MRYLGLALALCLAATAASAQTTPEAPSALIQVIAKELYPHWHAPRGPDVEKLVTFLTWELERDGTLAGAPTVVRQEGITERNQRLAEQHATNAIQAVMRAAPFKLPTEQYKSWKEIVIWRFDQSRN